MELTEYALRPRERHKDKDLGGPAVKIGYAKAHLTH